MAVRSFTPYSVPNVSTRSEQLGTFKGVDLTSGIVNVEKTRSPDAPNMMPDANGYPVKRPGYDRMFANKQIRGRINGAFRMTLDGEEIIIIHAGTSLYYNGEMISGSDNFMADDYSQAVNLNGKLWIVDGKSYKFLEPVRGSDGKVTFSKDGNNTFGLVNSIAKVPKITIGKRPNRRNQGEQGHGTSYEPFNLLTPMVTEGYTILESESEEKNPQATDSDKLEFYPTDTKVFYTSKPIANREMGDVTVKVTRWRQTTSATNGYSETVTYTESSGAFAVVRESGKIVFGDNIDAPGRSVPTGEDTVFITYPHQYEVDPDDALVSVSSYEEALSKVNKNRFCVLYGVNGAMDRIFMSGNPDEPNIDRYTDYSDPTMIGDTMYGCIGSSSSPIMGYSVLNNCLVTHKQNEENDRNAWVRYGDLDDDGDGSFRIKNIIQGDGAVSNRGYCTLSSEPVFISRRGIFAMTASDLTGERYQQKRSYYIDGALNSIDLSDSTAVMWGRFYVLAAGGDLYLLDTDQKTYESRALASTYQYECYVWKDISARVLWVEGDQLCFGDDQGRCFKFFAADNRAGYYHDWDGSDSGKAIEAYWTTPMMELGNISNRKTVMDVHVLSQPFCATGGTIYYSGDNSDEIAVREYEAPTIFDYGDINFNAWSYYCLNRPWAVRCGRKYPSVYAFQLRVENTEIDKPFGIYAIQIDYHTSNKIEVR